MQHSSIIIIVLLILFGLYRRTRRTIGFQQLSKGRMTIRMTIFVIIGVLFLAAGYRNPAVYLYDAIGIGFGGIVAYYAIRTTSFEWRQSAWFYRPNPWIGVLLLVLFFGRIAYRFYLGYTLMSSMQGSYSQTANNAQFMAYSHDPLTAVILFMLITYYIVYYTFVIRKEKHLSIGG